MADSEFQEQFRRQLLVRFELWNRMLHVQEQQQLDPQLRQQLEELHERILGITASDETIRHQQRSGDTSLKHAYLQVNTAQCGNNGDDTCAICLGDYKENDKIGTLECKHCFHAECIKGWLLAKNNCPMCRSTALKAL